MMSRETLMPQEDDIKELIRSIDSASNSGGIVNLSTPIKDLHKSLPSAGNLVATGLVLASLGGCVKPRETPTPVPTATSTETLIPSPTVTKTEVPTKTATVTRTPTETPLPTPTETLKEKWGGIWEIGGGLNTGGEDSGLTEDEQRKSDFILRITQEMEKRGESLSDANLFIGVFPRPELDENGKPIMMTVNDTRKAWGYCAYIFGQDSQKGVYCASEVGEGEDIQFSSVEDILEPNESIWGSGCFGQVAGSLRFVCPDGERSYRVEMSAFGTDPVSLIPQNENGDDPNGKTLTGYLFTAQAYGEEKQPPKSFFLDIDADKMPVIPAGKLKFDDEHFFSEFDLLTARINVWTAGSDHTFTGYRDLRTGKWMGEKGFEDEGIVWVDKQPEKPTDMLDLKGFTTVWSNENNRWEYLDVDGLSLAYWNSEGNESKGRIEITFPKDNLGFRWLDLEKHKGLFVEWTPEQAEEAFLDAWSKGEDISLPLVFTPNGGLLSEDQSLSSLVCFKSLNEGTVIRAPFDCKIEKVVGVKTATKEKSIIYILSNEQTGCIFWVIVSEENQFLSDSLTAQVGDSIVRIGEKALPSILPNERVYNLALALEGNETGMSFENLQRDEFGRFVYVGAK